MAFGYVQTYKFTTYLRDFWIVQNARSRGENVVEKRNRKSTLSLFRMQMLSYGIIEIQSLSLDQKLILN